jgi:hypothetical protein
MLYHYLSCTLLSKFYLIVIGCLDSQWSHWKNPDLEQEIATVLEVVSTIRSITNVNNISGKVADGKFSW